MFGLPNSPGVRKFTMGIFAMMMILAGYSLAMNFTAPLGPLFTGFVGGITGIFLIFTGGNVGSKMADKTKPKDKE